MCKLKFDQLYCSNELLANDVLLGCKIILGYEESLWPKKLEIRHASQILTNDCQILVLSYLITTVRSMSTNKTSEIPQLPPQSYI